MAQQLDAERNGDHDSEVDVHEKRDAPDSLRFAADTERAEQFVENERGGSVVELYGSSRPEAAEPCWSGPVDPGSTKELTAVQFIAPRPEPMPGPFP